MTQTLKILQFNLIIITCTVLKWQIRLKLFNYATASFKSLLRHSQVSSPPSHEVINYKVFHGWGGKDKSLLDTSALDYSQLLRFLKYGSSSSVSQVNCGKKDQSSDCCTTTQNSEKTHCHHLWWKSSSLTLRICLFPPWRQISCER